ncbi:thymidine kinase 2, mitochondrial-like [Mizuhopecten yessoensis]|uniref:Thymidine kinase 2, mitochondrial n=1 Tax=Mizuhopecten yessoensis TaxID=6573 RepID=A0A210R2L5_MIZYE|nr:thymidine kinase 2, mitochondrial-like [Mizuhopecten yessoensis]OWF55155.1 Thymidine kinase 2, mitochondrial [Mizuhopecten yessoensis]
MGISFLFGTMKKHVFGLLTKGFVSTALARVQKVVPPTRSLTVSIMGKANCKKTQKLSPTLYGDHMTAALSTNPDKVLTICVEGNIASGKTTFLEHFKKYSDVQVYEEPVKKWRNVEGHNVLAKMYEDPERWSLTLQTYVQLTMVDRHIQVPEQPIKLMERSIFSAKYCFVENLYKSGKMTAMEYVILTEWFDWIRKHHDLSIDLIVYLQTKPETVYERIMKRCRKEEITIPMDYLYALHELHEDWLVAKTKFQTDCPILVIDANQQTEEMIKIYQEKSQEILFHQPESIQLESAVGT